MIVTKFVENTQIVDTPDEWKNLVKELELEGQESLAEGTKNPIPFRLLTSQAERIVNLLCSEHSDVKTFNKVPIPMEVLALYGWVIREGWFEKVEVWHEKYGTDPFLVGLTNAKRSEGALYLIARWGDEDITWDALEQKARVLWEKEKKAEIEKKLQECKAFLSGDTEAAFQYWLKNGWFNL
jgi:hypothetical protein